MNYFLNYKDGSLSINTAREPGATVCLVDDLIEAMASHSPERLTASFDAPSEKDGTLAHSDPVLVTALSLVKKEAADRMDTMQQRISAIDEDLGDLDIDVKERLDRLESRVIEIRDDLLLLQQKSPNLAEQAKVSDDGQIVKVIKINPGKIGGVQARALISIKRAIDHETNGYLVEWSFNEIDFIDVDLLPLNLSHEDSEKIEAIVDKPGSFGSFSGDTGDLIVTSLDDATSISDLISEQFEQYFLSERDRLNDVIDVDFEPVTGIMPDQTALINHIKRMESKKN